MKSVDKINGAIEHYEKIASEHWEWLRTASGDNYERDAMKGWIAESCANTLKWVLDEGDLVTPSIR